MALTNKLTAIADAIRAKSGKSDTMTLERMPVEIEALRSEEILPSVDLPDYVKTEAAEVAAKVRSVLKDDSIVSVNISDSHYVGDAAADPDNIQNDKGDIHACMALKALTYLLPVDYIVHHGDVSRGTVADNNTAQKKQISDYLKYFREAVGNVPVFVAIGNHDSGVYYHNGQTDGGVHTLRGDWLYENFTALSESDDTVVSGQSVGGYLYRDFPDKKLRVFLLNTSEKLITDQTDSSASDTQILWVAQALQNLNTKTDASEWGFVVLSHYAIDYGSAWKISRVFNAYVSGANIAINGTSVNFSGSNKAKFYANFHGHCHCFKTDSIYGTTTTDPNKMQPFGTWRICTPNTGYNAENPYSGRLYYNIDFGESTAYPKTPDTANDTSFVLSVITPSENVIHSFCYGAGYDRELSLEGKIYYSVTKSMTLITVSNESETLIEKGGSYTCKITANAGYNISSVVIKMGGVDITSTAYNASTGVISISSVTGDITVTAIAALPLPSYTNLLPTAETLSSTDPLNGVGYQDGNYLSSSTSSGTHVGNTASGYVCTGLIPYSRKSDGTFPTIYIKGCEWAATSQCRIYYYSSTKGIISPSNYGGTGTNGNVEKWQTITTLGDKYCSFDSNSTMDSAVSQIAYFAISLEGSGKDLIITLDEPIE